MDLEDQIAKIIKDEYAATGFADGGCSTAAAHNIMLLLNETLFRVMHEGIEFALQTRSVTKNQR